VIPAVEVRLRIPDFLVALMALGLTGLLAAVILDGQSPRTDTTRLVLGVAVFVSAAILIPVLVALVAGVRAERQWRYRLRLDDEGVHLRKGPIWKLRAVELPWNAIGSAVLVHRTRRPAAGVDTVCFLPPSSASSWGEEFLAFAKRIKAKDAEARSRMWVSHPRRKEDVRGVLAYLVENHPDITVHEVTA